MIKIKYILLTVLIMTLTSCFNINDTLNTLEPSTTTITLTYDDLANQVLSSDKFTQEELKELRLIDKKAKFIIDEFKLIKTQDSIDSEALYSLYKRVKVLYIQARGVIHTKYEILPIDVQLLLYKFDYEATNLDRQVEAAAYSSEKRKKILQDIQTFVLNLFKLLIPLLLV